MRVTLDLKGLHKTSKLLADGSRKSYYYAWKGGPRLTQEYGTPQFIEEFRSHRQPERDLTTLGGLIINFKAKEFPALSASTQRSYAPLLDDLRADHGDMPVIAIEELGSRLIFETWRDKYADRPRTADLAWTIARRVLNFSVKSELLKRNPCIGASGFKSQSRKEIIWTESEIALMHARAPAPVVYAMVMALETGQRQSDLLNLQWSAYDGTHIRLQQGKTGKRVEILVSQELRNVLDKIRDQQRNQTVTPVTILTNQRGKQWTADGFRTSWGKAVKAAGITGKTFHDLRGTFITRARRAGNTAEQIASISGHSAKTVHQVLEAHYLASDQKMSDAVILSMNKGKK